VEGVKREVPALARASAGRQCFEEARLQACRTEGWSESAKAAGAAVLPEFKSKTA